MTSGNWQNDIHDAHRPVGKKRRPHAIEFKSVTSPLANELGSFSTLISEETVDEINFRKIPFERVPLAWDVQNRDCRSGTKSVTVDQDKDPQWTNSS